MSDFVTHQDDLDEVGEPPGSKSLDYQKRISTTNKELKEEIKKSDQLSTSAGKKNVKTKRKEKETFPNYISREEVETGLKAGILKKGILRINSKFTKHSYVEIKNSSEPDYLISTFVGRNRALDMDEVVVKIKDDPEGESKEVEVVYIIKKIHPRLAVGYLEPFKNNKYFALFSPRDKKVPKMSIYKSSWPKNFGSRPEQFENVLFLAQISKWDKVKDVQGEILELLGSAGHLKPENLAILRESCLYLIRSKNNIATPLLQQSPHIRMELFREDLRRRCVLTIDNAKTKDMDDALSCQELPNGNFEIGVHISDVSHHLEENSELDKIISKRATSVYLVDVSHHMLPNQLLSLCALQPGRDKLTFSVFFEVAPNGEIKNRRAGKTMINSCVQLSYEQAQMLIDQPDKIFGKNELPPVYNGFTPQDLSKAVNTLYKFSILLKDLRKRNCGLAQHRNSVSFRVDAVTGEPTSLVSDERIASQELVEEFMILANFTVAKKLYQMFPDLVLLRTHEGPIAFTISRLKKDLESIGIHIDASSSKTIQESLAKYIFDEDFGDVYTIILNRLISKCMHKEKYVCSGSLPKGSTPGHFGLGFPLYTHFTSPIRRYADVVTHRLLSAALGYRPRPQWRVDDVSYIANKCNQKQLQAKKAEQASFDLYLSYYVERHQPCIQRAVVYNVKEESFDVVVFNTGTSVRIYVNTFEENWAWRSEKIDDATQKWRIFIKFSETKSLLVDMFTVVKVELVKIPKLNRLKAKLCAL